MKIAFAASQTPLAQKALTEMKNIYGQMAARDADVVVALGGDGQVLRTLYEALDHNKPVFALRCTDHVGFLCNEYATHELPERLQRAQTVILHPLHLEARMTDGTTATAQAINEISVIRETPQSARLKIMIDGIERIACYSGDGILVSSPAGSTAYNHSCGGPIMPLDANTLVMTAISGFRPRGWRYAVLPQNADISIETLETAKRPVRIEAGSHVFHNALSAHITLDRTKKLTLMFDPEQHLGERIVREQFML